MEVAPLDIDGFSRFNNQTVKMRLDFLGLTIKLLKCI